ncbi:MAG: Na/Pi cotransporter family protein [Lachnospiraceae bacterium]|nr:Na/Pi cotransporter family protein [Lachnospiraceae bacterium]
MDIFSVFTLFGGLALFLYGMDLMGKGLESASGGKLEKILEKLTSNVFKAVLLGAAVTAVIQSSSATTVMVVGFVNSGIMTLSRAIGIIMGANIGTTVTSWILSLTGIESGNFFIQLVKPSSFSPIVAVIGMVLLMFSKKEKHHNIGNIMVGFAVLMFGMDTMSGAVKPLADVPEFTNILLMFSNPILGVLAGTILTAVIQSSSASVGILQALCMTGSVTYGTAIPIIMGQNIGTCITAILSAIGANRNAKRAASIHLMFNMIATCIFLIVFYTINAFSPFAFLEEYASPLGIAVIHSLFNVTATIILLPFNRMFEKLAYLVIRETEEEKAHSAKALDILDERFLETTGYALRQGKAAVKRMFEETRNSYIMASGLAQGYDEAIVTQVRESENTVDEYENQICNYLLHISREQMKVEESQLLSVLLHTVSDIETISDNTCGIALAYKNMNNKAASFSKSASEELSVAQQVVLELMNSTIHMFSSRRIHEVLAYSQIIGELIAEIKEGHVERLKKGECSIDSGFVLTDVINSYEKIADRCRRIANYLSQAGEKDLEIHDHEELLSLTGYQELYESCKEKYHLN